MNELVCRHTIDKEMLKSQDNTWLPFTVEYVCEW